MTQKRKILHNQKLIQTIITLAYITPFIATQTILTLITIHPEITAIIIWAWATLTTTYTTLYIKTKLHNHKNQQTQH